MNQLEEIQEYVKFRNGRHPDNVRWLISQLKHKNTLIQECLDAMSESGTYSKPFVVEKLKEALETNTDG